MEEVGEDRPVAGVQASETNQPCGQKDSSMRSGKCGDAYPCRALKGGGASEGQAVGGKAGKFSST